MDEQAREIIDEKEQPGSITGDQADGAGTTDTPAEPNDNEIDPA